MQPKIAFGSGSAHDVDSHGIFVSGCETAKDLSSNRYNFRRNHNKFCLGGSIILHNKLINWNCKYPHLRLVLRMESLLH